jgi:hypothetical protein
MNYLDLAVQILPGADGRFDVRVASDEGEGKSDMALPFTLADLVGVVHGVHPDIPPLSNNVAAASSPPPPPAIAPPEMAASLGYKLFDALFQGETRDILNRTESRASNSDQTGVRIRLTMDLRDLGVCEAAALPWELMCRADGSPLAISSNTALVRAIDTPLPTTPRPLSGALRILALRSNPQGTPQLDLQQEVDAVEVSWAKLPGVEVDFVKPTQSAILDALAQENYHIIHYMGHGGFDPASVGGRLLLENDDGSLRRVEAETFAQWVADSPLRLVFLNACETGRTPGRSEIPPFAGVATALIRAGIPAVVGNQFSVTDSGAITFARTFYARIVECCPVDTAVALSRKAIYDETMPVQWATPVLYMRCRDGDLFPRASAAPTAPESLPGAMASTSAPVPAMPPQEPLRPMSDSSNRSISIGGAVSGSVIQTGNQNITTLTTTTLPPAESVDMNAVIQQLRAMIDRLQMEPKQQLVAKNALDEAEMEVKSPQPDKDNVGEALTRAVGTLSKANDVAAQLAKLAPVVVLAAAWVGVNIAPKLLALVGMTL